MESNDSFLISVIKIFIALVVICYIFMNKKCKENFANDTSSRKDDFSDNFKSKEKKIINDLIGEFKVTYTKKSNFQDIEILDFEKDNKFQLGRCLRLNGEIQLCNNDEHIYHEMLVHYPAALLEKIEHVLIIGGGDCMALREVMKHKSIKKAKVLEIDEEVIEVSKKFFNVNDFKNNSKVEIIIDDAIKSIENEKDNLFDLIIVDTTEDGNNNHSPLDTIEFIKKCKQKLKKGGILVKNGENKRNILNMTKIFKSVDIIDMGFIDSFLDDYCFLIGADFNVEQLTLKNKELKYMKNLKIFREYANKRFRY